MNEILKKRIEEAAGKRSFKYLSQDRIEELELGCHYEAGFMEGAQYALSHQWISVEEYLPEENEKVLVLYKHEGIILIGTDTYLGYNFYKMYGIINGWSFGGDRIIAWMPIPKFELNKPE